MLFVPPLTRSLRGLPQSLQTDALSTKMIHKADLKQIPKADILTGRDWFILAYENRP